MNPFVPIGIAALLVVPWMISRSKVPLGSHFTVEGMQFGFDGKKWVPLGNAAFTAKNVLQPGEVRQVNVLTPGGLKIIGVRWMADHWVEL